MSFWKRTKNGDQKARELLIESNYGLVGMVVKRLHLAKDDYEELFQSGVIGLVKAVDRYDAAMETAFASYAFPYIYGEILRSLEMQRGEKRQRKKELTVKKVQEAKDAFALFHMREPSYIELSDLLNIPIEELLFYFEGGEDAFSHEAENISDQNTENAFLAVENKIFIAELLKGVSEKQRTIILDHYFNHKTQGEIARNLEISQTRVSRLEKEALLCLKKLSQM